MAARRGPGRGARGPGVGCRKALRARIGGSAMTTYSAEQVAAISDADARRILTGPGIPDCPNVGFFAAETLAPIGKDPSVTQIGAFGKPEAPVGIDATGAVVNFSPWSDTGSSVVNTSVRAFVDTLAAIAEFGP